MTRSSAPEHDDWTIDMDAAECRVTDTRRLDRYVLEYLFTLPRKTSLLLLSSVAADADLVGGLAAKADAVQKCPGKIIFREEPHCNTNVVNMLAPSSRGVTSVHKGGRV